MTDILYYIEKSGELQIFIIRMKKIVSYFTVFDFTARFHFNLKVIKWAPRSAKADGLEKKQKWQKKQD